MDFDHTNGVREVLRKLAASMLVRQTLPNAAATCQQYFSFRRDNGEAMNNFLVREVLGYPEFVEALLLLYEDKQGIRQHDKIFDLPVLEDGKTGGTMLMNPMEKILLKPQQLRPHHRRDLWRQHLPRGQLPLLMLLVMEMACHPHDMLQGHQAFDLLVFPAPMSLVLRQATFLSFPWLTVSSWGCSEVLDFFKLLDSLLMRRGTF